MSKYKESAFLQRIAELDQLVLTPRVIDQEQDLRPPELYMLLTESKQILSDLVVDETLTDIAPGLGRRCIVYQNEDSQK